MTLISEEVQLGCALQAFGYAFNLGPFWGCQHLVYLTKAGITSMSNLATGCNDETLNMDLDFIGLPRENHLGEETLKRLKIFLPGAVGFRCFRLAQRAAEKVELGTADAKYVHRPESGKAGNETWDTSGDDWTLHVDCAGLVRSVLEHVTKSTFRVSLSDRSFMRAKDFYRFFETVPYTVIDRQEVVESDKQMHWRLVRDLRMVIPGDIIVYRPKGNGAGGAAFTTNDRSDLKHLLKAVKTSQLWHNEEGEWKNLVTRNVGRDASVKAWIEDVKAKLAKIGINTVRDFRAKFDSINELLREKEETEITSDTLQLMKECAETTALNTGHIVFASGPAELKGDNEYRIRVVHSTKFGKKDRKGNVTEGVQEYFRRFRLVQGPNGEEKWTREMRKAPVEEDDSDDSDLDDDDPSDIDDDQLVGDELAKECQEDAGDDMAGAVDVEVLAARMCF
mmetsp:Transcript_19232/g.31958  ORF Transcript_19232/g.31958 Transcript_19232/m.31958 type:complete len:450 (+) Transcript_19232:204-1553(+)|eukprot:CAMPEP_0119025264 /NCGR_PEP_ID=MMETSP1176-20130426/33435_1 /TAXON_ID=265551 /ORGANISM="Synedropsis recta cf, Strain CCMP1620" /LENGTH=449 /DNA_ID=CAMNT_0006980765 /DNA_START=151 /DNA_END=1500 /DNA_ORIENTATION=+